MRERVALAGVEANIGIVVLAVFLAFGVLAAIGVGVLLASGEVHTDLRGWATYAGGVMVVVVWARLVKRDLRAVRVVELGDDGSWYLRGPLGLSRGTITPDALRRVVRHTRDTWIFGVARRYMQVWATIEAGGRMWETCRGTLLSNGTAVDRLQVLASRGGNATGST